VPFGAVRNATVALATFGRGVRRFCDTGQHGDCARLDRTRIRKRPKFSAATMSLVLMAQPVPTINEREAHLRTLAD
jgi:hypothetical protein